VRYVVIKLKASVFIELQKNSPTNMWPNLVTLVSAELIPKYRQSARKHAT